MKKRVHREGKCRITYGKESRGIMAREGEITMIARVRNGR